MNPVVKILVIDDDEADRLLMKRALRTCGFDYLLTEWEGTSATDIKISENSFDCIFLDYLLPKHNGLLLLRKIRENGIRTPIVIVTSHGNESVAVEAMKAGASDYIVKNDITGQSLNQVIRTVLRLRKTEKEREGAENALKISESRLAEAQRIAKIGSWEFDGETKAITWSSEMYNILGVTPETFSPSVENFIIHLHPDDRQLVLDAWQDALKGKPFKFDFRVITPQGLKFTTTQGYTVLDAAHRAGKVVGTLQDITERKLFEKEILKTQEMAENSMKVREIFLANMSHEIRTPMNAILGFTRLLYQTDLSAEQKGFIDAIHFSGENLLVIINDILDLSKIQSGKMTIEKCEFNLRELIAGIISVLKPKAREKGLQLTSKIEADAPSIVKGDPVRLNQILTNLIINAIKFTEHGGVTLEVNAIDSQNDKILIDFKVIDTGIGISPDKQAVIFDNFVQASSDTTRKYGGTGLGLAIVKSLVELQDGRVSLSSQSGSGSTFTVHLPFEKVAQGTITLPAPSSESNESLDLLYGASILVVEDNALNQLLMKKVLDKTGCKIDIAANGVEAIEWIKNKKYDVVLMDVQMPEMDGYEATQYIRTKLSPPLSELPIIALTAHAFGSDVTRCIAIGMNDYLSKPFKREDLYAKIIKYLRKSDKAKIIQLHQAKSSSDHKLDLSAIYELSNSDIGFLNELIFLYDKQTPAFTERLRGYIKSQNNGGIKSICHVIKSNYGILNMPELDKALEEISLELNKDKTDLEWSKITNLVDAVISLISVINEEVKRTLRKTG